MKEISFLVLCFFAFASQVLAENGTDSVDRTFEFINRVQQKLKLTKNGNVTLVIGNTGSGKSTFVHYAAGDYSKLVSIEPAESTEIDYIIHDGLDPEIGEIVSTSESRTLVPEKIIDETGNVWYDCPGFGDTRSETIELATTFLIKSIIDNASNVKIVLVVNYASVTRGYNRVDFPNLVQRATQLITNIDRYKNSVSLVVSKVPPYITRRRKTIELFEGMVKTSAANYMSGYRTVLQKDSSNEKKIQLIDAFLEKTPNGDYPRISVFWRPSDAGAFNTIPKLVEGREKIRESVLQHTLYTQIQPGDFGFPLSDTALRYIDIMTHQTFVTISMILTNIDNSVLSALQQRIESIDNFHDRFELLGMCKSTIELSRDKVGSLVDLTERFGVLIKSLNITSMHLNAQFDRIGQQTNNLNILQTIAQTEINFSINDLIANSSEIFNFITTEHEWYSFLVQVYEFFASYETQNNTAIYNVLDLSDWGQLNKPQGLLVDADNFIEFTKRFPGSVEVTPTTSKLKELNEIIDFTLKSPPKYECNDETLTIKGNFVKSTDIQPTKCPSNRISMINVFVVSTLYVDSDLNLNGYHGLNIFAEKWMIMQPTIFNLNGLNGEAQSSPQGNGEAGSPGNVGMNGGNFIGSWNDIVNGDLLTVNLNGGTGGVGQDGTGSSNVEPSFTRTEHSGSGVWNPHLPNPDTYYKRFMKTEGYDAELTLSEKWVKYFALLAVRTDIKHRFRIHPKECCGPTGLGGLGGLGGLPGKYSTIKTGIIKTKSLNIHSNDGSHGRSGEDASPCRSTAIDVRIATYLHEFVGGYSFKSDFWIENRVDESRCSSKYVNTTTPISTPKPHGPLQLIPSIIEYKTFLRKNMKKSPLAKITRTMYDAIESNPHINRVYTVADFALEENELEKQYYELNEQFDFLPFYDNLMERIEKYAIARNLTSDREVLALLYTTVLSKVVGIRSGHQTDLIIDIERFFDLIIRNINGLDETARLRVIEEHRSKYNEDLQAKIDEANSYIVNDIQPEIEKLFSVLDIEMRKVLDETITLQAKTTAEIKLKEENEKIIRANAMIRIVTVELKVLGEIVSFLGPAGKLTAALTTAGAVAIDALLNEPEMHEIKVPRGVERVRNEINEQIMKNTQSTLDALESELKKLNDSLAEFNSEEFSDQMHALMSSLASVKSRERLEPGHVDTILKEFSKFVSEQKDKLVAVNGMAEVVERLQKTANALAVIETSISMYQQFSANDERLNAIGKAINADRSTLVALKVLEAQIYAELIPMINVLQADLDQVERNLTGKSSVALNVQQWKVHDTLRSVQRKLVESISGFKNEYGVENCLVKVDEAFKLIINIYDRIQTYQDQSKLVIYLSDLQSTDHQRLNVQDAELIKILNELQFNLQANIILSQYNRAIDAFKQAVFPFAADYLDIYQLPATFSTNRNLSVVASTAADRVKLLSERIKELNTTVISQDDSLIHTAYFDRDNVVSRPFYVWPNTEFQTQIKQLFTGEKIYLLADVKKSSNLNAVKFNRIDLQFRSSNQSTNDQLKQMLQSFHVVLTHMGESNYRCNRQFYTISSRPQTIEYSFGEKNHEPVDRNVVYDKLRSGVKLLSPYTLWAIQLKNGPVDELKPFAGSVDIELHGHGQYVAEDAEICKSDLREYYSAMSIL